MPYFECSPIAAKFMEDAYKTGIVLPNFDWPEWARTVEASRFFNDPSAVEAAGAEQLFKLLTACLRQDKFCEGAMNGHVESGLIPAIAVRAISLLSPSSQKPTPIRKLSSLQAGQLGELLALAKLNTLGCSAYSSPEGAPGHDIIVVLGGIAKSVEVKTRQFRHSPTEITRWPVNLSAKGDADYFLFVELDLRTMSPTFYLLTNAEARSCHKDFAAGQGNCYPAQVRKLVSKNDFTALVGAQ